jgi:hypothetical protein
MALPSLPVGHAATAFEDSLRVLLIVALGLLIMIVATALLGWHGFTPSLDILPDPVGPLPF